MKLTIQVDKENKPTQTFEISPYYLLNFVDMNKEYEVEFLSKINGIFNKEKIKIKGEDLIIDEVVSLFVNQKL